MHGSDIKKINDWVQIRDAKIVSKFHESENPWLNQSLDVHFALKNEPDSKASYTLIGTTCTNDFMNGCEESNNPKNHINYLVIDSQKEISLTLIDLLSCTDPTAQPSAYRSVLAKANEEDDVSIRYKGGSETNASEIEITNNKSGNFLTLQEMT